MRRLLLLAAVGLLPIAHAGTPFTGQGASQPPLRIILPVSAGSGIDTLMRGVRDALSEALDGQPVVLENIPGAGGIIGTRAIVDAAPDGRTIGMLSNNIVFPQDPGVSRRPGNLADITPISVVASAPFVLVVNAQTVPAGSARELQAFLAANRDAYNYGSSGTGTITHLAAKLFLAAAHVNARHIPYTGTSGMLTDLLGGRIEMAVFAVSTVQKFIESGALRPIGVMSRRRVPALPRVPTFAEQGFPEVELSGWVVAAGPAKLGGDQVKRIYDAFAAALKDPAVRASLTPQGYVIELMPPAASARFLQSERDRYARLMERAEFARDSAANSR
jgi:tripartite-type tricarboxylate transporter receptor subunit TctC